MKMIVATQKNGKIIWTLASSTSGASKINPGDDQIKTVVLRTPRSKRK